MGVHPQTLPLSDIADDTGNRDGVDVVSCWRSRLDRYDVFRLSILAFSGSQSPSYGGLAVNFGVKFDGPISRLHPAAFETFFRSRFIGKLQLSSNL